MNPILNAARFDPTRTTLIRQRMVADTAARVRALQRAGATSPTAIRATLGGTQGQWAAYMQAAYRKGVEQAWSDVRQGTPPEEFGILRRDFLRQMEGEIRLEGKRLAQRVQSEMQGVAQDVATRVSRAVHDARDQHLSKANRDKAIREAIEFGRNAAAKVVHTEITRAYANGQLSGYETLGLDYLEIEVEWVDSGLGVTAKGNPSPCPKCKKQVGKVYKLSKAKGLIPFHPYCMCRFKPVFKL